LNLIEAKRIAEELLEEMRPYCIRCEIAGSIRRRKTEVKDIEIVVCPSWEIDGTGLFADEFQQLNRLLQWAFDAEAVGRIQWIKPGAHEIIPWEPKREGKYWRGLLPEGIKLDLFLTAPENWGIIFLIRTGAAEFSEAVVTHAKHIGKPCINGSLTIDGKPVETREEQDVFDLLNLAYIPPEKRIGRNSLRGK
jgi:DNA polymerase/3'-5' exonuclease PolX